MNPNNMPESIPVVPINPEEAAEILGSSKRNRLRDHITVERYANAMREGRWQMIGDPIRIDVDGNLIDGQHRLAAVVLSETTQYFALLEGLPVQSQRVMDSGRLRTAAQQARMEGWGNSTAAAALVRTVLWWDDSFRGVRRYDTDQVMRFATNHAPLVRYGVTVGGAVAPVGINRPAVGALAFRLAKLGLEAPGRYLEDDREGFFRALSTGAGLEANDPVLVLRNLAMRLRTVGDRRDQVDWIYYLVRTWNAHRRGEKLAKLQRPSEFAAEHFVIL